MFNLPIMIGLYAYAKFLTFLDLIMASRYVDWPPEPRLLQVDQGQPCLTPPPFSLPLPSPPLPEKKGGGEG